MTQTDLSGATRTPCGITCAFAPKDLSTCPVCKLTRTTASSSITSAALKSEPASHTLEPRLVTHTCVPSAVASIPPTPPSLGQDETSFGGDTAKVDTLAKSSVALDASSPTSTPNGLVFPSFRPKHERYCGSSLYTMMYMLHISCAAPNPAETTLLSFLVSKLHVTLSASPDVTVKSVPDFDNSSNSCGRSGSRSRIRTGLSGSPPTSRSNHTRVPRSCVCTRKLNALSARDASYVHVARTNASS